MAKSKVFSAADLVDLRREGGSSLLCVGQRYIALRFVTS